MGELLNLIERQRVLLERIVEDNDSCLQNDEVQQSSECMDKLILMYYTEDE